LRGVIAVDSRLVLVPVSVTDKNGRTVDGLRADQFTVFENGVAQPIVAFGSEDTPASIGLVFDLSGSMNLSLPLDHQAVHAFTELTNPEDEAFLVTLAGTPTLVLPFFHDISDIQKVLFGSKAFGSTALVDAVYLALTEMRNAHNQRRAIMVISDGVDNHSRHSEHELLRLACETDAQIYSISVVSHPRTLKEASENSAGRALLREVAVRTGGRHFDVLTGEDVTRAMVTFVELLRNQYVISYKPTTERLPGKWTPLRVRVIPAGDESQGYHTLARSGYYAPSR